MHNFLLLKLLENCKWTAFEYFMMVAVCGLLLILVPSVFILSKMYNRRTEVLAENHRHAHVQYPRVSLQLIFNYLYFL